MIFLLLLTIIILLIFIGYFSLRHFYTIRLLKECKLIMPIEIQQSLPDYKKIMWKYWNCWSYLDILLRNNHETKRKIKKGKNAN